MTGRYHDDSHRLNQLSGILPTQDAERVGIGRIPSVLWIV